MEVATILGSFGRWQIQLFAFFFFCGMFSSWNSLSLAFFAPALKKDEFLCAGSNDTCYTDNGDKCTAWTFQDSPPNIIKDFNLVCDRSWLVSASKSAYMFGTLCVVAMSQVADRIGRRPVILIGIVLEILAGVMSAVSPGIWLFIVSRYLLAIGNGARWGTGFVLLLEVVGTRHRDKVGIGIEFGWALGYIILPALAIWIPNWRHLQITCTIIEVPFLPLAYFLVTESPRWLISQGKHEEAFVIIKKAGQINSIPEQEIQAKYKSLLIEQHSTEPSESTSNDQINGTSANGPNESLDELNESKKQNDYKPVNILHVWADRGLRIQCLLLYLAWATNGFVYYGLSFNTNELAGDPYLNFFLSGLVEIPAYVLCLIILHYSGRKMSLVGTMVGAGVCFLLIIFWSQYASQFSMAGKFFITCSFAIIYLYSGEIFPTVARTVGLGSSSLFARIGAIAAPFVKELGEVTSPKFALVIFGALAFTSSILLFFFGRETKGIAMQDLLGVKYSKNVKSDDCNNKNFNTETGSTKKYGSNDDISTI